MSDDARLNRLGPTPSIRTGSACSEAAVLDLTAAQMERASRLRDSRRRVIPKRDVVAVGGGDLRARSVEQPFPADESPRRARAARLVLLCALLIGVGGGYFYAAKLAPERSVIEVSPPESRQTIISAAPPSFPPSV